MMELKIKNVLVLGISGTIGNIVFSYLNDNLTLSVFGTNRKEINNDSILRFDVLNDNIDKLIEFIKFNKIDYVINCIGNIRPNGLDLQSFKDTIYINSYFPRVLGLISNQINFNLIHISTDCVFDGYKGNYKTSDIPNEKNIYGLSKFLGEIDCGEKTLTIRTSIIGEEKNSQSKNLLNWFLTESKLKDNIYGFSNVLWNGITTLTLSKIIERIIIKDIEISGLIQVSSNEILSKFNLLKIFNEIYETNVTILENSNIVSDKTIISSDEQKLFNDIIPPIKEQILDLRKYYLKKPNDKNIF